MQRERQSRFVQECWVGSRRSSRVAREESCFHSKLNKIAQAAWQFRCAMYLQRGKSGQKIQAAAQEIWTKTSHTVKTPLVIKRRPDHWQVPIYNELTTPTSIRKVDQEAWTRFHIKNARNCWGKSRLPDWASPRSICYSLLFVQIYSNTAWRRDPVIQNLQIRSHQLDLQSALALRHILPLLLPTFINTPLISYLRCSWSAFLQQVYLLSSNQVLVLFSHAIIILCFDRH